MRLVTLGYAREAKLMRHTDRHAYQIAAWWLFWAGVVGLLGYWIGGVWG